MSNEIISTVCRLCESFIINKYKSEPIGNNWEKVKIKGLYFKLVISCNNHGYDKSDNYHPEWEADERQIMHYIVTANNNVFLAITDFNKGYKIPAPEEFKNTSNHNSCWRSDGFSDVHKTAYSLWKKCWIKPEIPADQQLNMLQTVHYSTSWILSEIFKPVEIVHERDAEDDSSYFRKIVSITEKKAKYIIED